MNILSLLAFVFACGCLGGVVNALMTDNGFVLPKRTTEGEFGILKPGMFGNVLVGGVASMISWGLYGPFASTIILRAGDATSATADGASGLTLAASVGAVLVGIAGSRWLTNEVDKSLLRAAASSAASGAPDEAKARAIAIASPTEALRISTKH